MQFVLFELPCGAWTMCRLRQRCRRRLCGLCLATMLVKPDGLVSPAAGCDIGHGMGGNGRRGVALLLNGGAGYDGRYAGGTLLLMQQARRCCCSQVLLLLARHGRSRGCFLRFQPQLKRQRARVVAALPRCDGLKTCFSSFHHPLQPSSHHTPAPIHWPPLLSCCSTPLPGPAAASAEHPSTAAAQPL